MEGDRRSSAMGTGWRDEAGSMVGLSDGRFWRDGHGREELLAASDLFVHVKAPPS
jgi:hypothetical protein